MRYSTEQAAGVAAIQGCVATYSRGLDRLDPELMMLAYWPDGIDERFDGPVETFARQAVQLHAQFAWTMHCLHNHFIEFDPATGQARGELYVTALLQTRAPGSLHTFHGRYLDLYEQRDGDWRILRRACVHEGSATAPVHPAPFPFETLRPGSADRPSRGRPPGP
jgi:hypothetical protein